jgi:protein phosphatase
VQAVPEMIAMATGIAGSRGDNVTALAIRWQGAGTPAVAADPSVVSTQMVPEGEVASRIDPATASGSAPGADDPFDEDDIEKAIAEIRDAIEKSSQVLKPTNN